MEKEHEAFVLSPSAPLSPLWWEKMEMSDYIHIVIERKVFLSIVK